MIRGREIHVLTAAGKRSHGGRRGGLAAGLGLVCALVALSGPGAGAATGPADWRARVAPRLLAREGSRQPVEYLVVLSDQADLRGPRSVAGARARQAAVVDTLRETARRSQAPLLRALSGRAEVRPFWIANLLWVRSDWSVLAELAARHDVLRVDANPLVRPPQPEPSASAAAVSTVEPNLAQIGADLVWSMLGYTGQGVVIGSQDTGHDWTHPALQPHYRGWDGVAASHAYNWHDAIHSGTSSCPPDSPAPCDDNGHGTHTIGIVVGDDGGTNRIGVAPGAEWIACRNMRNGAGTPATYTECFQWFMAPTDAAGQNPDPSRAPSVITNSWFCPTSEGCDVGTLELVVNNVRAAGIVVVVSAGNDGPTCSSLQWAPAIYDASFSVAAVDGTDQIAAFSSRGPVTSDGSNRLKPDIAAPGVSIRSSWPGAAYVQQSGTSMAAPHVAGVIALLLEARPDLVGDVDTIEGLVRASAVPETTTQDCGTVSGLAVPNNTFGFGRIDAFELIAGDADGDASGNVTDCLPLDGTTWQVPSPVADLRVGLAAGEAQLNWTEPSQPGSTAVTYDVLRSLLPGDFSGATCIVSSQATPGTADAEMPGDLFAYLVRTNNGCGGSIGSGGGPVGRSLPACP